MYASRPTGRFNKEKNLLPLPRFKPLDLPALSGVTTPTTLPRLMTKNQLTEVRLLDHGINAHNTTPKQPLWRTYTEF